MSDDNIYRYSPRRLVLARLLDVFAALTLWAIAGLAYHTLTLGDTTVVQVCALSVLAVCTFLLGITTCIPRKTHEIYFYPSNVEETISIVADCCKGFVAYWTGADYKDFRK